MEIIWNSLLIAAAVCLVLFLLATADHGDGGSDGERDAGNTQIRHVQ